MKPQSAQRKTLCSQKEFSFKDKTEQGISCATEAHKNVVKGFGINTKIYGAQLVTQLRKGGLLINFNAEQIKAGKNDQSVQSTQRGDTVKASKLLIINLFSVFSVVFFLQYAWVGEEVQ